KVTGIDVERRTIRCKIINNSSLLILSQSTVSRPKRTLLSCTCVSTLHSSSTEIFTNQNGKKHSLKSMIFFLKGRRRDRRSKSDQPRDWNDGSVEGTYFAHIERENSNDASSSSSQSKKTKTSIKPFSMKSSQTIRKNARNKNHSSTSRKNVAL